MISYASAVLSALVMQLLQVRVVLARRLLTLYFSQYE